MTAYLGRLRDDLTIEPYERGGEKRYRVIDPKRGTRFEFDALEYQVARSFDGVRDAQAVVTAVARFGFAVSAQHVAAFHREIAGMGFTVKRGEPEPMGNYQSDTASFTNQGLMYLEAGKLDLARGLFEAALELDPTNTRASEGLARVEKENVQAPSSAPSPALSPAHDVTTSTRRPTLEPEPRITDSAELLEEPVAPPPVKQRSLLGLVLMGVVLAVLAGGGLFLSYGPTREPLPEPARPATAAAGPAQPELPLPALMGEPTPAPTEPAEGAAVAPPAEPGAAEAAPAEPSPPEPAEALEPAPPGKPERLVAKLAAGTSGHVSRVLKANNARVSAGDKVLSIAKQRTPSEAERAQQKRVDELQQLAAKDPAYEAFLLKAQKALAQLKRQAGGSSITLKAPAGGRLVLLVQPGAAVKPDTRVAEIYAPEP